MTYHALNRTQRKIICPFHSSKAFAVRVYSVAAESERTEQNSSERRAPCAEIILARPPALASKAINTRKYVTLSPVTIRSLAMLDRQDRGRRACALPLPRSGKDRACARPTEGRAQRFVQTGMTLGVCPKGGRKGRTQRFVRTGLDTQHADDSAVLNRSPIWPHDPRSTWWDTECASVLNLKTRRSTG